jgi:hypothetical protein
MVKVRGFFNNFFVVNHKCERGILCSLRAINNCLGAWNMKMWFGGNGSLCFGIRRYGCRIEEIFLNCTWGGRLVIVVSMRRDGRFHWPVVRLLYSPYHSRFRKGEKVEKSYLIL